MHRIDAQYPRDDRRVVLHPLDVHGLRDAAPAVGFEQPDRILGYPVHTSDAVPRGKVLLVKPVTQTDVWRWLRESPATIKQPTKAQRRRAAKRFIREEIARRRFAPQEPSK